MRQRNGAAYDLIIRVSGVRKHMARWQLGSSDKPGEVFCVNERAKGGGHNVGDQTEAREGWTR